MTSWKNNNVLTSRRFVEEVLNPAVEPKKPGKIVARNKEHLRGLIEARIKDLNLLSPEKKQELDDLVNNSKVEEKNEEEIKVAETENPTDGDSNTKPKTLKKEKSTTSKVKTKKTKEEK